MRGNDRLDWLYSVVSSRPDGLLVGLPLLLLPLQELPKCVKYCRIANNFTATISIRLPHPQMHPGLRSVGVHIVRDIKESQMYPMLYNIGFGRVSISLYDIVDLVISMFD
jgi:hypothetical protein